jgi:hypothetical protein
MMDVMRYEEHFDSWAGLSYDCANMTRWDTNDSTELKRKRRTTLFRAHSDYADENIRYR